MNRSNVKGWSDQFAKDALTALRKTRAIEAARDDARMFCDREVLRELLERLLVEWPLRNSRYSRILHEYAQEFLN